MEYKDERELMFPREKSYDPSEETVTSSSPTPYDEFRYPGKFYPHASPEHMASIATLFGLNPPPVERSRILELACGEGGQIIPLAYVLPESRCRGVDLSQASITRAQELAERLDLPNVQFVAQDLQEFPEDAGEFDYIIAHGVYSWVPEEAQQAILNICERHLARDGLAYISYNTFPGGHARQVLRDLTTFHTRAINDAAQKISEAKNILELIFAAIPPAAVEGDLLRSLRAQYQNSDALTRFDLMAEVNEPDYFLDFMERASVHGLQFVAESDIKSMRTEHLREPARSWLDAVPDRLLREQYLDFINVRSFRKTILCRSEHHLDLEITPQRMDRLMLASSLKPLQPIGNVHDGERMEFRAVDGRIVASKEAIPKAAYLELGMDFPRCLPYRDLRARICTRLGYPDQLEPGTEAKLIQMLVASVANEVVQFHVYQAPFCMEVSQKPLASALARIQAESGDLVTSMYLVNIKLDGPIIQALLPLLDGTRDKSQLLVDLRRKLGETVGHKVGPEELDALLKILANCGLLIK